MIHHSSPNGVVATSTNSRRQVLIGIRNNHNKKSHHHRRNHYNQENEDEENVALVSTSSNKNQQPRVRKEIWQSNNDYDNNHELDSLQVSRSCNSWKNITDEKKNEFNQRNNVPRYVNIDHGHLCINNSSFHSNGS
jgi:hypothetical protein